MNRSRHLSTLAMVTCMVFVLVTATCLVPVSGALSSDALVGQETSCVEKKQVLKKMKAKKEVKRKLDPWGGTPV